MTEELAQKRALLAETKAQIAAIKTARRDALDLAKTTAALAEAELELQSLQSGEPAATGESWESVETSTEEESEEPAVLTG